MGFATPLRMVVRRGFSVLIVCFLSLFTACGGLPEDIQLMAPGLSVDDSMPDDNRDGTYIGSPVNDPNKIFVSYNDQEEMPKIKMGQDGVLKCSLRQNSADVQLSDAQFTISQGELNWVLPQQELRHSDLTVLGGHIFSVSCAGSIVDSNGFAEWVVSNSVQVLLSEVFATTDSLDGSQPLGQKISLSPQ